MEFDVQAGDAYRLLTGLVVPRPIAWVTTVGENGVVNAAPYSFFNLVGSDPPVVVLGISRSRSGSPKDTARNIETSGAFVVNLVNEAMADQMNITAIEFPSEISEIDEANLTLTPSVKVDVPRLLDAPASLECRYVQTVTIGSNRIILGEVVYLHVQNELWSESENRVLTENAKLIGRMHGGGWYARTSDRFFLERIRYTDWETAKQSPE